MSVNFNIIVPNTVYLVPARSKRLIHLWITVIPSVLLVVASVIAASDIMGEFAVRILAGIFGLYAVIRAFMEYRNPETKTSLNPNTIRVMVGLLLLAVGAMDYRTTPDMQLAHLLFVTGCAVIFAGAMFPGLAKRSSIVIKNERMEVTHVSGNDSILELNDIEDIRFLNGALIVLMTDGTSHQFSLKEFENGDAAGEEILKLLKG